jgi:hypothetical protein
MDWVGAVTAGAAGLAALLAGVNLYVSGRRELDKWTRETLIETFAVFLDASFKHASACRGMFGHSLQTEERNRLRSAVLAAHDVENEALTRLRLLAPPSVVVAAQTLMQAEYNLAEPCFLDSILIDNSDTLIQPVRRGRAQFIEAARSALGLREVTGTASFVENVVWRNLRHALNEAAKEDREDTNSGP